MISAFLVLFYILTPFLIMHLCERFPVLDKIGAIVIAYVIGLIIGVTGLLGNNFSSVQDSIVSICIPLAISLLLFSSDFRKLSKLAGKTIVSMLIAIVGAILCVVLGYIFLNLGNNPELWKIGGLLVGVYTGGTPNMAALKLMLNVQNDTYLLVNAYDMVISGVYFLFLLTVGQKLFLLILPKYKPVLKSESEQAESTQKAEAFGGLLLKKYRLPLAKGAGLSIVIFIAAGLITLLFPKEYQMLSVILIITSLGIGASFVPSINRLPKTFELGMYLILIFSLVVASMVNIRDMINPDPTLIYYVTFAIFGSLTFHVLVAAIFRIDADTVIVTSTALINSAPFVPAVAGALKNKEIVVPGITVGLIGYAIGNYAGVVVAEFLKTL